MTRKPRKTAIVLLAAAALMPAAGAQAQWYSSVPRQQPAPLYPYAVQSNQPYAVQVAPNTYVIQRPAAAPTEPPRARKHRAGKPAPVKQAAAKKHRHSKVDPKLVEELRDRLKVKTATATPTATINTKRVVVKPPIVKETKRYVDDPPRVVERYQVVDDRVEHLHNKRASNEPHDGGAVVIKRKGAGLGGGEKRVIDADAEITILGPDRMSIRLFRKGSKANASAD